VGTGVQVMRQLEEQKLKAQDADVERAQAVSLMIREKEKTRIADEACAKVRTLCLC
jgi:hypothetical protein